MPARVHGGGEVRIGGEPPQLASIDSERVRTPLSGEFWVPQVTLAPGFAVIASSREDVTFQAS